MQSVRTTSRSVRTTPHVCERHRGERVVEATRGRLRATSGTEPVSEGLQCTYRGDPARHRRAHERRCCLLDLPNRRQSSPERLNGDFATRSLAAPRSCSSALGMPRATRRHRALLPRDPLSMERSPAAALVSAQGAGRAVRRTADALSPPARWPPPASRRAIAVPPRCCAGGGAGAGAGAAVILAVSIAAAPGAPRRSPHHRTSLAATHRLRHCPTAGGTVDRVCAATVGHLCDAARSCRRRCAAAARQRHPRRRSRRRPPEPPSAPPPLLPAWGVRGGQPPADAPQARNFAARMLDLVEFRRIWTPLPGARPRCDA